MPTYLYYRGLRFEWYRPACGAETHVCIECGATERCDSERLWIDMNTLRYLCGECVEAAFAVVAMKG